MKALLAAAVLIVAQQVVAQQVSPPPIAPPAAPGACAASEDPTYGYTKENPVQVGGGAMYVAARERRYMDALRGPEGQVIRYKRTGSEEQTVNSLVFIDRYEVTYDGLEKPLFLYLDAYHFWEQRAPKGLTCGQAIQLQPMVDQFKAADSLKVVAVEQGATRDIPPIPLDSDGSTTHGVVLDGFRLLALASRAAAAGGATLSPEARIEGGTTVVAYPLSCDSRTVAPIAIDIVTPQGQQVQRNGDLVNHAGIAKLLPGLTTPAGSIAARYPIQQLGPNLRVRVRYAEAACPQGATEVWLPLNFVPARPSSFPEPALPEGANSAEKRLMLQVLIDLTGELRQVSYAGGPKHLEAAALEAAKTWRAEPARVNGAPVPTSTLLQMGFK
jgi:hypothetical protein